MRVAVCDRVGTSGHNTLDTGLHDLPAQSGPLDKQKWKQVEELTPKALGKGAKKK
jgi:hypothetical protein